jgi:hypothetical protein
MAPMATTNRWISNCSHPSFLVNDGHKSKHLQPLFSRWSLVHLWWISMFHIDLPLRYFCKCLHIPGYFMDHGVWNRPSVAWPYGQGPNIGMRHYFLFLGTNSKHWQLKSMMKSRHSGISWKSWMFLSPVSPAALFICNSTLEACSIGLYCFESW